MLVHSRGNQSNDDPQARESAHLDANDVAPICPMISLCSCESIHLATLARGNQYITNDVTQPAKNLPNRARQASLLIPVKSNRQTDEMRLRAFPRQND